MESQIDYWTAHALLEWQVELGATEAICDVPVDRYALQDAAPKKAATAPAAAPVRQKAPEVDAVQVAKAAAQRAGDLNALKAELAAFEHCALKKGAHNLVFSDGSPDARVMVIGEAPGRDEDLQGLPFVGRAGHLLDKMFAAIGMARSAKGVAGIYITNVLPWRPPQNRDPKPEEIAMMVPFVTRHIELAKPDLIVLMGNISCQAMLGKRGITRLRGNWTEVAGVPALPMFHPAYLLRSPHAKREAWADLLSLQARLRESAR
jgi:uracil-DNA glycosylase family 4